MFIIFLSFTFPAATRSTLEMFLKSIPSNSGRELHELVRSYFIYFEWKFDPDNLITKITVDTAWSSKRRFSYFLTSVDFISARRRPVISLQAWHIQVTFFLSDHVLNLLPTTILNNLTILPEYLTDLNGKKIQEKFSNFSNVNLIMAHMEPVEEKLERFSAERKL